MTDVSVPRVLHSIRCLLLPRCTGQTGGQWAAVLGVQQLSPHDWSTRQGCWFAVHSFVPRLKAETQNFQNESLSTMN